jgi:anti-sigma regulatory factor (Ser/Thr protein kinase)
MRINARRRFECSGPGIRAARQFLREALGERADPDVMDDLVLAMDELATNAVEHAGTPFEVVIASDGEARIEVEDSSPRIPQMGAPAPWADRGRGLRIVDHVCDRWGVHVVRDRKCVWCERRLA